MLRPKFREADPWTATVCGRQTPSVTTRITGISVSRIGGTRPNRFGFAGRASIFLPVDGRSDLMPPLRKLANIAQPLRTFFAVASTAKSLP